MEPTNRQKAPNLGRLVGGAAIPGLMGLVFLLVPILLQATNSRPVDTIDGLVRDAMEASGTPGVAVLVIRDGRPLVCGGFGYADLEHRVPVTPKTVFESGSIGKQFTATLVMMLVQEGRLKLDDPIVKFFPEGAGKWDRVTVRQLLNHTSGIGDVPYDSMDCHKDYAEGDLASLLARQPVCSPPGEKWLYNNGGYVLLGILIHRVTGRFYGDLLRERIFEPLDMASAQIIDERGIVPNRSMGYEYEHGRIANQDWVSPTLNRTADGALYLSLRDMEKWDDALRNKKLLGEATLAQMWAPARLTDGSCAIVNPGARTPVFYGFGWTIRTDPTCTWIAHGGGWQGFRSYYAYLPERKLSVVVFANLESADVATLGKHILEVVDPSLRDGQPLADHRIP